MANHSKNLAKKTFGSNSGKHQKSPLIWRHMHRPRHTETYSHGYKKVFLPINYYKFIILKLRHCQSQSQLRKEVSRRQTLWQDFNVTSLYATPKTTVEIYCRPGEVAGKMQNCKPHNMAGIMQRTPRFLPINSIQETWDFLKQHGKENRKTNTTFFYTSACKNLTVYPRPWSL